MTAPPSPNFSPNDEVYDKARRYGLGRIIGEPERMGGDWIYTVRFEGGNTKKLSEKHLESREDNDESIEQIVLNGRFGSLEAFQRAISVARIRKESANRSTIYSFDAQRVQFQAYQYKPLLRFLDSEDRRLLIADEVGLGKTIEAGIILAELEARQPPERVLVVCPSRLREKWWEELNRKFAQDFEIWGLGHIREYDQTVRQNPNRSRMRAIVSLQGVRNQEARELLVEAAGRFDLLILDEAHHIRNRGTQSYQTIEALVQSSDAVLFLTATPIHLRGEDLFNQLRLLRPAEFRQADVFAAALHSNEGVVRALARVRTRKAEELELAARDIEHAFSSASFRSEGIALVQEAIARLRGQPPAGLREWIDLERDIERLHYLANIITRTRKREVQTFASQRQSMVVSVKWTAAEHDLFRRMTGFQGDGNWPTAPCGFGGMQRERMAASSLFGTLYFRNDACGMADLRADGFDEDPDPSADVATAVSAEDSADRERPKDSKLDQLLQILDGIQRDRPGAKVLVFSYFVGTSRYLEAALNDAGIKTLRIAGDVPSSPGRPELDARGKRVREFREDASVRVLVSTEVGSEGLDFQFCSTIVNYDLPWNPMTVEQRIGRIDRYGQQAEKLHIWSLVVEGSIEERILARLYTRIGIFERSIGPLETILGEMIAGLRSDYFNGRLTPAEAEKRVKQSEEALEKSRVEIEKLDVEADRLFGHEDFIRAELERVRRLGRYVTPEALLSVVGSYLAKNHGQIRVVDEGKGLWSIRMSDGLAQALLISAQRTGADVSTIRRFTKEGRYYFALEGTVAYDQQDVDLLNASHPLILTALDSLEDLLKHPVHRTGVGRIRVRREDGDITAGIYIIASFRIHVTGLRERSTIETAAASLRDEGVLDPETAECLLHLVLTQGDEPPGLRSEHRVPLGRWEVVKKEIVARATRLEEREAKQNQLLAARRRSRLQGEHDHQMSNIQASEATARERGNFERMEKMLAGQRDKARIRLEEGLRAIEAGTYVQASIEQDPVAVCLVEVVQ